MQGTKLPDLTRMLQLKMANFHDSMKKGDLQMAENCLSSINMSMPADIHPDDDSLFRYRVVVSTSLYAERGRQAQVAVCPKCGPVRWSRGDTFERPLNRYETMARGGNQYTAQVWRCPDRCKQTYDIRDAQGRILIPHRKVEIPGPRLLGVIPQPPKQRNGTLLGPMEYYRALRGWLTTYEVELTAKIAQYRLDYTAQTGEDIMAGDMPEEAGS